MSDGVDAKMQDAGKRQGAPQTASETAPDSQRSGASTDSAESSECLLSQRSIDMAIGEESSQWTVKRPKRGGHFINVNRDVFELLQISGGRECDHFELQAFMDIFNSSMLLYDTKFSPDIPHLTSEELATRQKLLDKYLTFDLPQIHTPANHTGPVKRLNPFEMVHEETRSAHSVIREQEDILLDAYKNASTTEAKYLLGDAYDFCGLVNALLIDPTLQEGAYEDLFRAFCKLACVNLSQGKSYQKKATVLGKEVTACPDFRILRKDFFTKKPTPSSQHPGVVAVVDVRAKCLWQKSYERPKERRPNGYEYTCNMRGQLLGDMLLHLDISSCITKPQDVKPSSADTFAIVGISVVSTKVCFCLLEMPREQYNAILVADREEAYQYRIRMDEMRRQGIRPAVVRYTECLDMTSRMDRPVLLKVLHMIGHVG